MATEIRIDNTGDESGWLYSSLEYWKDYIGCENFDEEVVLTGNKDFAGCTEAKWYQEAKEVLENMEYYDEYPKNVSDEVKEKLWMLYENCRCSDDILIDIIRLLNPEDTFKTGTIRGYTQGEWQNYIIKGDVDVKTLENMYFGQVADVLITTEDNSFGDIITHDELWEAESNGIEKALRKRYEIPDDEKVTIYKSDGYKRIIIWEKVN